MQPRHAKGRALLVSVLLLGGLTVGAAAHSTPLASPTIRDPSAWPFASDDPWNVPLGSDATFDSAPVVTTGQWINYAQYSVPIYYASKHDPLRTVTTGGDEGASRATVRIPDNVQAAAGSDRNVAVISPDRRFSDEWWLFDRGSHAGSSGDPYRAGRYLHVDLRQHAFVGTMRGAGTSLLGGLIRPREIASRAIRHVLAFASHGADLEDLNDPSENQAPNRVGPPPGGGPCPIWPAVRCDGAQEAGLLAIPRSTAKPKGLSPLGAAIWDALQHYGAYDVDNAGGNVFYAQDQRTDPGDASAIAAAQRDMPVVEGAMRWVTNNSQRTPGGPGARLAPGAPRF